MTKRQALKKNVDFWLKASQDNLQIAKIMFETGHYSFCMFMCQQVIEAMLKAVFIVRKEERPPYIHKLPRLLELTGVKVPKDIDTKIL